MDTITLECWVYDDDVGSIFPVEIPKNKTVGALKEIIKDKITEFRDVAAKDLRLYSILIPQVEDEQLKVTLKESLEGKSHLNSRTKVSNLFPEPDAGEWLVVVNGPRSGSRAAEPSVAVSDMTLNCWVRGQESKRVFPVEISPTKLVGTLREVIKHKKPLEFCDIDADALALYKVYLPFDADIEKTIETLNLHQEEFLKPLDTLSESFPDVPPPKHIHIVIEAPLSMRSRAHPPSSDHSLSLHNVEIQRLNFLKNHISKPPSSAGMLPQFAWRQDSSQQTIYCNRPHNACTPIPPTLLHEVFGKFLDDCETCEVTWDDNSLTVELHVAMSNFYGKEAVRAQEIRNILARYDLPFVVTHTDKGYVTDGDMSEGVHRYALAEFKNEVGSTGAEPYHQASLYYLESTKNYAAKLWDSSLPCIIILMFGPYIAFAGATWNTRPVVQPLSVTLPMHYHPTDTSTRMKVARHLRAFKNAVNALKKYYERLTSRAPVTSSPNPSHLFPYRSHFIFLQDQKEQRFRYVNQPFPENLLFFGNLLDGQPICIKFVHQYSQGAHEKCVSIGCAPKLRGFEKISGGWFIVIMDKLDQGKYIRLCDLYDDAPTALLTNNIRDALKQLHKANYVHGDVRDTNIMVSKYDKTKFMLIDFDWAGKFGEVRYPMNVTRTANLWRPEGAVDGALIRPEHDMDMLDNIERQYRIVD